MTVALYARVSTTDQNCAMQLEELEQYCRGRGWTVFERYSDTGVSGAKSERPALDRMLKDATKGKVAAILVWKLDRFGRSLSDLVRKIEFLQSINVRLICTSQGIDTDRKNPAASLMTHILGAVAEFEREIIRERMKAGVESAKSRGVKFGRPAKVFDREKVIAMARQGKKVREIAAKLNLSRSTVQRTISA